MRRIKSGTIRLEDQEIRRYGRNLYVTVEFEYTFEKGTPPPVAATPDSPGWGDPGVDDEYEIDEVKLDSVMDEDGNDVDLTDDEKEEICNSFEDKYDHDIRFGMYIWQLIDKDMED